MTVSQKKYFPEDQKKIFETKCKVGSLSDPVVVLG